MKKFTTQLAFRITVPVIIIWLTLGYTLYSFVNGAASEFIHDNIQDDMRWLSRQTISICNTTLDEILRKGLAANPYFVKIHQNRAILEIEEFLREFETDGIVSGNSGETLFATDLPLPEKDIESSIDILDYKITTLGTKEALHYATYAKFDPWGWKIVLLKPAKAYTAFQDRMKTVYLATGGALSIAVGIIFLLIYWSVNAPVGGIIRHLVSGNKPEYKGVYEIEYLSDTIATMMESQKQMNKHLEEMVEKRTRELALATSEAESATQAKSDFVARMSHEIRTPMNAVIGFTNMVLKSELTPTQRDYLQDVNHASHHLLKIINDILDFSKIEAGKLELHLRPFALDTVLEKMADMFRIQAAEDAIDMYFIVDKDVPCDLVGDSTRIRQILINLIANAIKFTEVGEIVVKVELDPSTRTMGGDNHPTSLVFSVKDSGTGIPSDKVSELFQPFTQADGSVNRSYEGTGLGLTICQRLVEKMGGKIWVDTSPGQGSTFYFNILLELQQKDAQLHSPQLNGVKNLNVLVLDENISSCQFLREILSGFGYLVTTTQSVEQCIGFLQQQLDSRPCDLVFIEESAAGIDAFEAAAIIKKDPQISRLDLTPKVIVITAHNLIGRDLRLSDSLKEADIDGFYIKPFTSSGLFSSILEVFERHKSLPVPTIHENNLIELEHIKGARVLLVEDNEINRKFAVNLLEMLGLHTEIAKNGQIAIKMLKNRAAQGSTNFDVVLMDIEMPVMDGYTATRIIRSDPTFESLPIIAMTAHALKGTKEKCLEAGMNDYIPKPIEEEQLCTTLAKHLKPASGNRVSIADPERTKESSVEQWHNMPLEIEGINLQHSLKLLGNNSGLLKIILTSFLSKYRDTDKQLTQLFAEKEIDEAARFIHSIKGIAGNIGAEPLHAAAEKLELQLRSSPEATKYPGLEGFTQNLQQITNSLLALNLLEDNTTIQIPKTNVDIREDLVFDLLEEIKTLLNESDSKVRHTLPRLKTLLEGTGFDNVVQPLENAIYQLDSNLALKELATIQNRLKSLDDLSEEKHAG